MHTKEREREREREGDEETEQYSKFCFTEHHWPNIIIITTAESSVTTLSHFG